MTIEPVGLNLQAIRTALAKQIAAGVQRKLTAHPYDPGDHKQPAVVIREGDPYVTYFITHSGSGVADVLLEVDVEVATVRSADAGKVMDDYLSSGDGCTSSIADAVNADHSLGGAVASCVCLSASRPVERDDGVLVATLPIQIMVAKQNAEVG